MNHFGQQEEVEVREWGKALDRVDNIFKVCKGSSTDAIQKEESLAVVVARWKVVWGKKPAQYRLKPFLRWSVDEMLSIPEECESFPAEGESIESFNKVNVEDDPVRTRNDKQLRVIRRKMFKLNRRMDEITVLLVHGNGELQAHGSSVDDSVKHGHLITGCDKAGLIAERNIIWEKLRKNKKKLVALKAINEYKRQTLEGNNESRETVMVSDVTSSSNPLFTSADQDETDEALNFKNARRSAIKKEGKTTNSNKVARSPMKDNGSRKNEPLDSVEDKRTRKTKFCKKHRRKVIDRMERVGREKDTLGRRTVSEGDLSRLKELRGEVQQTHDRIESRDKDGSGLQVEVWIHRKCPIQKCYSLTDSANTSRKFPHSRNLTERTRGCSRRYKNIVDDRVNLIRNEKDGFTKSGSQVVLQSENVRENPLKFVKKDLTRIARVGSDVEENVYTDSKRNPTDQGKLLRTKKTKEGRTKMGRIKQDSKESLPKMHSSEDTV